MPVFFVHQSLKDREHRLGQIIGAPRDLEHAKAEEGVETFAITEIGEGAVKVAAQLFERALFDGDAVALDHQTQQPGMPRLLEPAA